MRSLLTICVSSLVILISVRRPLVAQDAAISATQAEQIIDELRQIRKLLEAQTKPVTVSGTAQTTMKMDLKGYTFLGSQSAPATIVEFTDFQCPFCQRFYFDTFRELKANYIDPGKVRFYSLDLPLPIHKDALQAAEAGRCAAERGKYWELRDRMQADPSKLDVLSLLGYAKEIGLDQEQFRRCVVSGKYESEIQRIANNATSRGVQATPTFILGKSTAAGVEGEIIIGAQTYETFDQKLKQIEGVPIR